MSDNNGGYVTWRALLSIVLPVIVTLEIARATATIWITDSMIENHANIEAHPGALRRIDRIESVLFDRLDKFEGRLDYIADRLGC